MKNLLVNPLWGFAIFLSAVALSASGQDRLEPERRAHIVRTMEQMDERRQSVQNVMVRATFVLHNHSKEKEYKLTGVYLGDSEGNLRLRIMRKESYLIDLAFHGNTATLALPRKDNYYQGTVQELMDSDGELALMAHAGRAHDLFFPRAWSENAVERRYLSQGGRDLINVLEMPPGKAKAPSRRIALDLTNESGVVELIDVFHASLNKHLGTIRYGDYAFPQPQAGEVTSQLYPRMVTLSTEHTTLEMHVEDLQINKALPPSAFTVSVPEGMEVRPLSEKLSSDKGLFN